MCVCVCFCEIDNKRKTQHLNNNNNNIKLLIFKCLRRVIKLCLLFFYFIQSTILDPYWLTKWRSHFFLFYLFYYQVLQNFRNTIMDDEERWLCFFPFVQGTVKNYSFILVLNTPKLIWEWAFDVLWGEQYNSNEWLFVIF